MRRAGAIDHVDHFTWFMPSQPHIVYRLGPDIPIPPAIRTTGTYANGRVWVLLDQLLTHPTLKEAIDASRDFRTGSASVSRSCRCSSLARRIQAVPSAQVQPGNATCADICMAA